MRRVCKSINIKILALAEILDNVFSLYYAGMCHRIFKLLLSPKKKKINGFLKQSDLGLHHFLLLKYILLQNLPSTTNFIHYELLPSFAYCNRPVAQLGQ